MLFPGCFLHWKRRCAATSYVETGGPKERHHQICAKSRYGTGGLGGGQHEMAYLQEGLLGKSPVEQLCKETAEKELLCQLHWQWHEELGMVKVNVNLYRVFY